MGLFSGLKNLGLGDLENTKVIEEKHRVKKETEKPVEKTPEELEAEMVMDRTLKCPICDIPFPIKFIRSGKAKLAGTDTDLRPRYEKVDPLKYDAIACPSCGYAALTKYFEHLGSRQMKDIKINICPTFKGFDVHDGLYTYDDAILRHKLALLCAVVKNGKNSERAYTALKLAWMLRGKRETIVRDETKKDEVIELYNDEMEALSAAYEGFTLALSKEVAPIAGMDENTLLYLLAELARKLKKFDDASRLCGSLLLNKSVPPRLKERTHDLKGRIQADMKKQKEKQAAKEE